MGEAIHPNLRLTTVPTPRAAGGKKQRRPRFTRWLAYVDTVRGSLFALTLVSISAIHMYLGPLRLMRPTITLLLLVVVSALLNRRAMAWRNLVKAWPARLVLILFVLACASAVFGISPGGSVRYILDRYGKVLIGFVITVAAIRNPRDLALLVWSYVAAVGVLLILSVSVFDMEQTMTGLGRMEGGETMYDGNDLGMLLVMGIPAALLTYFTSGRVGRWISLAVLAGIPAAIALTGSRGAMVGLVALAPVLFLMLARISVTKRLAGVLVLVGAMTVGAPEGYWKQMQTILDPSEDYNVASDYGRVEISKRGVGYALQYPVFGVGVGNFGRAEGTISPIAAQRLADGEAVEWIAPHNTFVQVAAEMGIPALVIWLLLLFGGSVGLWKLRRRLPRDWEYQSADRRFLREACLFLPGMLVAFAVTSYFLNHAYTPPVYLVFALLAGLTSAVQRELDADKRAGLPSHSALPRPRT